MQDIHGNILEEGDMVYALTSSRVGVKYKRLFYSEVIESDPDKNTCKVKCFETGRVVSLTEASIIKPLDN